MSPRDTAANAVRFHPSVSAGDQVRIREAIREMVDLATAAANIDYTGGLTRDIYTRWMPVGREDQVKALFKYIAGIPQVWGTHHLNQYDFSQITIARKTLIGVNPLVQAQTIPTTRVITISAFGMQSKMHTEITNQQVKDYTSFRMEFLGAVLLHELL